MKLSALQIERFGARSNLQLDNLADRLNVIYGPNGSGKTTIINFIRWVMFGGSDETSRRYLTSGETRVGGSLSVVDGQQRQRVVTRFHDATRGDQVRVTSDGHELVAGLDRNRLTGVDLNEHRLIFCFSFDQPPAMEQLVQIAIARDFALAYDENQLQRLRDLNERLESLRRSCDPFTGEEALNVLLERRRQVQAECEQAERVRAERLRQIQAECDRIAADIVEDRRQIDELEAILRRTEAGIETRRRELEQAVHEAQLVRERWLEDRRQEVAAIDDQIQQWHGMLETIRQRHERLQALHFPSDATTALAPAADEAELRVFLRSLGYQHEDIEQDLRDLDAVDGRHDERTHSEYLKSVLNAALHTMRDDVRRLSRELQRQHAQVKHLDQAREQDHLRRCEFELTSLIDALSKRRQSLVGHPEYAEVDWSVGLPGQYESNGHSVFRPWYETRTSGENGVSLTSARFGLTDPVLEARLSHLQKRRDHLNARLRELEGELAAAEHRLQTLQGSRLGLEEERHLDSLRRELEVIDQRIRQAEQRQRQREEIAALERQIEELRRTLGPSNILREASAILSRLTEGAYRGVRITDRREVWVEDQRGHSIAYGELSRGTRDQVYLGLALALVAAYRRRGVELPLILNDIFINIDADRAQATAEVLAQFAAQGHQLILFTRHEHILQRFTHLHAKLYTLRERTRTAEPPRVPLTPRVDPVPRSATYYLDDAPIVPVRSAWDPPAPAITLPEPSDEFRRQRGHDWVAHWEPPRRPLAARPLPDTPQDVVPAPVTEATVLADVEWLPRQPVQRLHELGLETVRQFLEMDPQDGERQLNAFAIPAATLFRWQSQLALQCHVGLAPSDAALLVACGVDDPEELSYIDVSELHRRLEQFLSAPEMRSQFGSIARFERSRLSRWIQAARRSHFRRHRQRGLPQRAERPLVRSASGYRAEATERLAPRARRVDPATSEARRITRSEPERRPEPPAETAPETLRFYLEPSDPIVDAPSIGPKTAERFHAIGVTTIAELLDLDPSDAAARIAYRRITAEMIRSWQLQTTLVCRVPNLRGHDAQILVACEVPGPEQLAKMEPETLVAQVKRFVRTAEGKRVLRSAKEPDLGEVSGWIRWAQNARPLESST